MTVITNPQEIAVLVHRSAVEILEEVGFCVPDKNLLARLASEGFPVETDNQMVRITPQLLDRGLDTLPGDVKLHPRSGQTPPDFKHGSTFMGAGTPIHVFDLETGVRRKADRTDVKQLVRIQDDLPQVDIVRPTVTATDQGERSDLVEIAELLRGTAKPVVHRTLSPDRVDAAAEMIFQAAGGKQEFQERPFFATLYCPISPGYFTPDNIRCMLRWASHGIPITLLSMAMGGASAPATLLGELVVINADILAWIIALQILYPGTPLLYGSVSAVLDMRTGLLPLGAPERGLVNAGAAIMGDYYGIPSMCGGLSSDAKQLDTQAGFEKVVTAMPLLEQGASIIYGVGATDAGATISYTQMVFDNEIIGGLRRLQRGIPIHDLVQEIALIKKLTPRGNFLTAQHTRNSYRRHWYPEIISRDSYTTWESKGMTIEDHCRQKAQEILSQPSQSYLSAKAEAAIEDIMRSAFSPNFRFEE